MSKPARHDQPEMREEADYAAQAKSLKRSTEAVEAERNAKKFAREEKNFYKEIHKKNKARERWVAPLLFVLTFLISFVLYYLRNR